MSTGAEPDPTGIPTDTSPPGTTTGATTTVPATSAADSSSSDDDSGRPFVSAGDVPAGTECSTFDQDCPRGEKCTAWASDGTSWDALRCVPVDRTPDPIGAPCTVEESGISGIDSCEVGAMCWGVDDTGFGRCIAFCSGTPEDPMCSGDNATCTISGSGVLALCFPACNPLDPQACPDGQGCYPVNNATACAPDASADGGALFETCAFLNSCDPGLMCANSPAVGLCKDDGVGGCCTPFCAIDAPACPDGLVCTELFATPPPILANVGACLIEGA